VRGTFRGVVHGEFETGPGIPAGPAAAAVLVVALASWLATILLVLAVVFAFLAALLGAGFWLLSRRNPRDAELLAERAPLVHDELNARLRAGVAARAAPAAVENHYHLHLPPGTDARGIDWAALPHRDDAGYKKD
jgi:hypothetical protein